MCVPRQQKIAIGLFSLKHFYGFLLNSNQIAVYPVVMDKK